MCTFTAVHSDVWIPMLLLEWDPHQLLCYFIDVLEVKSIVVVLEIRRGGFDPLKT